MYNDPNQPQPPPYGQPGQPQPPYPQTPYGQPPPQYNPPQYGAPPNYNYMPPPNYAPPPKKSRRGLWITLAIIGGILVLGCVVCGVFAATGIGFFAKTVGAPAVVATQYYTAIQDQDYAKAYSYLDPNATLTIGGQSIPVVQQTAFSTAAATVGTTKGKVTSFSPTGINVTNNIAHITMTVTRNGQSYDVHLQLQQEGSNWKITNADGI